MDTRRTLLVAAAAVVVVSAIGVAATPAAVSDPRASPNRAGTVDLADVVIAPGAVRGETVRLDLRTALRHRGPATPNVTVRHRALDADSGLLVDETVVDVGSIDGDRETGVNGSVTVERSGGYRLETVVYADGQRRDRRTTEITGVSALEPSYADSSVGFATATSWPTVAVSVVETSDATATLSVAVAVTNRGDEAAGGLELRLLLRQADSNVIADEAIESVGSVRAGRTDTVTTRVTVPDGYNYYVDAALFDDDVLIDETQGVANLDPETTISANETVRDVSFETEDFSERDDEADTSGQRPVSESETEDATPGFGIVVGVVALLGGSLLARRRQ